MDDPKEEQLKDAMSDMADHASQALRDVAAGKTDSAAVNREFAQADCDRATDILNDIIAEQGDG